MEVLNKSTSSSRSYGRSRDADRGSTTLANRIQPAADTTSTCILCRQGFMNYLFAWSHGHLQSHRSPCVGVYGYFIRGCDISAFESTAEQDTFSSLSVTLLSIQRRTWESVAGCCPHFGLNFLSIRTGKGIVVVIHPIRSTCLKEYTTPFTFFDLQAVYCIWISPKDKLFMK